jgi:dihydroorotate dehydrogenase
MSKIFEKVIRPTLFRLDAERAHELGLKTLELGFVKTPRLTSKERERIKEAFGSIERFGLMFSNPLGIAAGFDKNGVVVNQLSTLGFGFVEVGTVTHEPQPGNPKPRLFRLLDDKALINRLGFNNDGAVRIAERLGSIDHKCVVGVNIGRNKEVANETAVENYLKTFEIVHPVADYIAVNVSSPNTPGLRDLQSAENLEHLLGSLQTRNSEMGSKPLLIKIAPDLDEASIESIVDLCLRLGVSGVIATNTTIARSRLRTRDVDKLGSGGLSGLPLQKLSNSIISQIYHYSHGRLPIIGVGGVFTAKDAFEKIAAGASLIQAYTGFIYSGPSFAHDIIVGLSEVIREHGFKSLDDAVGSAVRQQ